MIQANLIPYCRNILRDKTQKTQLKWILNEENLSGINRLLHTTRAEGTFFQVHMEHSPSETMFWEIKQTSTDLKELECLKYVFLPQRN